MPVTLPHLPDEFAEFGVCVTFESDNLDCIDWVKANTLDQVTCEYDDRGENRWLEVTLECPKDNWIHLHIEASRMKPRRLYARGDSNELASIVHKFIEKTANESPAINSEALIVVPRSRPVSGVIAGFLNFADASCGASLSVNNVTLDIKDEEEVFRRMRVNFSDELIAVRLYAQSAVDFDTSYLVRLVELMQIGADCFVFERADDA